LIGSGRGTLRRTIRRKKKKLQGRDRLIVETSPAILDFLAPGSGGRYERDFFFKSSGPTGIGALVADDLQV